jgi:hypothetical protein
VPSGHVLIGAASDPPSPGCWIEQKSVSLSGVKSSEATSQPRGPLRSWRTKPRCSPFGRDGEDPVGRAE